VAAGSNVFAAAAAAFRCGRLVGAAASRVWLDRAGGVCAALLPVLAVTGMWAVVCPA
jgi:hypothetical protein